MYSDGVLYVIGNGFDLHHRVKSGYGDFEVWLKRCDRELYHKLSAVCKARFLWSDFERALGYVQRDYFLDCGDLFLPRHWTEDDSIADLLLAQDAARGEAELLWQQINRSFRRWVRQIAWSREGDAQKIRLDYNARFITFNYTPFLTTRYGIAEGRILYIHGRQNSREFPPLIGHDATDTFDDWWQHTDQRHRRFYRGSRAELPEVAMLTEEVETYYDLSAKPVGDILAKHQFFFEDLYDIRHVYVMGHSLGRVDLPYFTKLIAVNDAPDRLVWHISYYRDEEREQLKQICTRQLGIADSRIDFFLLNSLRSLQP